jgi:hypothetical protein
MAARIMYRVIALAVALLALSTGAAAPARAADSGDVPTAVLGLEAIDAPDNLASAITDALRQRVASVKGLQLVQGKDLVEIKLVFSCSDEAPACLAQAGKSLGVAKLIFGNVKRAGSDYLVKLALIDVAQATVEGTLTETVANRRAEATDFRALAQQWVAKLTGQPETGAGAGGGTLQIRSNVSGAAVSLDGNPVGVTAREPLSVAGVAPGQHELMAQKAGYETRTQQFTMGNGQSLPLSLTLAAASRGGAAPADGEGAGAQRPAGRADETPTDEAPSGMARPGFWIAMAFTAASAAAATYYGLQIRQINKDLDPFRSVSCGSPTGYCDLNGAPVAAPSQASRSTVAQKLDQGDRDHTYQIVSLCVGGAFLIAGGFLFYKGYLDKEPGSGPATSENHGLRIFPTGTASSGGIVAEFDF